MKKLVILSGVAGSGKSTYVKDYIKNNKREDVYVLETDKVREELYKGVDFYDTSTAVVIQECINRGKDILKNAIKDTTIIFDATSLSYKKRIRLINDFYGDIKNKKAKNRVVDDFLVILFTVSFSTLKYREIERKELNSGKDVGMRSLLSQLKAFQLPVVGKDSKVLEIYGERFFKEGFDPLKVNSLEDIFPYAVDNFEKDLRLNQTSHDCPEYHKETVEEHINMCIEKSNEIGDDILKKIAVFHDLGKGVCKDFRVIDGVKSHRANFSNHENISAMYYLNFIKYRGTPINFEDIVILYAIKYHMQAHIGISEKMKNKYNIHPEVIKYASRFAKEIDDVSRIK